MNISTYRCHEIAPSQTSATTDEKLITMWLHGKSKTSQKTYTSAVKQFLAFVGKGLRELKLEDAQMCLVPWKCDIALLQSKTRLIQLSHCSLLGRKSANCSSMLVPLSPRLLLKTLSAPGF